MEYEGFTSEDTEEKLNQGFKLLKNNFWNLSVVLLLAVIAFGTVNDSSERIKAETVSSSAPEESTDPGQQGELTRLVKTIGDYENDTEDTEDLKKRMKLLRSINSSLDSLNDKDFEPYVSTSVSSSGASKSDIEDLGLSTESKQDDLRDSIQENYEELKKITESTSQTTRFQREQVQDQAESETLFGEQITAERNVEIDLVSDQGTSVLRDVKITNGSASIPSDSSSTGEIMLKTGTQKHSRAVLETANLGRYSPGAAAQMGIGFRELEKPEGEQYWKAGLFEDDDGFFFGRNSTCLYVASKSNGEIDKKVCQKNWNGQDIDETLGRDWSPQDGTILQIDYSWYGFGAVRFSVVETNDIEDADNFSVQNTVALHTFTPEGNTSISDPIQPIRIETYNGNKSEDYQVRVGGRQFSILGPTSKVTRISNDGVTQEPVASSDFQCLVAFRKDSSDAAMNTESQFYGVQGLSSSSSVEMAVFYNANITDTGEFRTLENTPNRETGLVANRNCELASSNGEQVQFSEPNGTEIWNQYVSASNGFFAASPGSSQVNGLNVKLPKRRNMVLAARSLDGTSTEVSANMRFIERK